MLVFSNLGSYFSWLIELYTNTSLMHLHHDPIRIGDITVIIPQPVLLDWRTLELFGHLLAAVNLESEMPYPDSFGVGLVAG